MQHNSDQTPEQTPAETPAGTLRVAIQGVAGCFHDAAARNIFAGYQVQPVECETFNELFELTAATPGMSAVAAIENTIAGSILPNHELLRRSRLRIVGEYKMRISHVLCALPGQSVDALTEVRSHPMALMQCEEYLLKHRNMRMVEAFDTAGAARDIAAEGRPGVAAICGALAAELYELEVLAPAIETNKHNYTRFLALVNPNGEKSDGENTDGIARPMLIPGAVREPDKSSIAFTLPHTRGALSKVLTILSFYDINLSKIQSLPIVGREWEYRFYVNLTFDDHARYLQALDAVRPLLSDLRVLGEYNEYK